MSLMTRTFLIVALLSSVAGRLIAQETTTTTTTTTATATTTAASTTATETVAGDEETGAPDGESNSNYRIRNQFTSLLREHPAELSMILKLDPSLLSNEAFMSGYPEVAKFVAKNPQILGNPRFYLAEFRNPNQSASVLDDMVEIMAMLGGFGLATFAFSWLVRTTIEQKRWNKLSKTQSEVHNKILDRFGSSEELLQYIRTPAGTKFLESAPIPLHVEKSPQSAPFTRIMWSIQLGVVIAIGALGMLLVSFRFEGESGQGLFALGAIGFCVGVGFVASAVVSMALSRRLGLWQGPPAEPVEPVNESGLMR